MKDGDHRLSVLGDIEKKNRQADIQEDLDIYLPQGKKWNERLLQGHCLLRSLAKTPHLPLDRVQIAKPFYDLS